MFSPQTSKLAARRPLGMSALSLALFIAFAPAQAEKLTLLHVGDQESWLLSAQGNLRDNASQAISFYGGVDRLASVMANAQAQAEAAGRTVLKLNAGDAFLPGPRWNASKALLGTAHADGGQDFFDAIAMRHIGFHAAVFGNHEFDEGAATAARFAAVSGTTYLSSNLNFQSTPAFASLANAGRVAPYTMVSTSKGHQIALVGATTPLLPRISSPGPVSLLNHDPLQSEQQNLIRMTELVQQNVDAARAAGAKTVVLMSHLQNWNNERQIVIPRLQGVDVVVSGGGHELMADADDRLLPGDARALTGHPQLVKDRTGRDVAVVTSSFGNRYVGELNIEVDDSTGAIRAIEGSRLLRVSGNAADADRVQGDSFLKTSVIDPVKGYVDVLNSTRIGSSQVSLNGVRGSKGLPGSFEAGVRNSETNLGNLVADAMRFAGKADVAIQNGGGIRAGIAAGDVTVGDTFNVLPFTNLVRRAPSVDAGQLKQILEHSVATASAAGDVNGRFAQVSGLRVIYDTQRNAGSRVLKVTLDDGTVLIDNGVVVNGLRRFSLSTIDFTAAGGDGYPFAAAGVLFENAVDTITYQEALERFISSPLAQGGLGGLITAERYGTANPLDAAGRLVDVALAPIPEPGTYGMMALGLGLLGWLQRRRRTAHPAAAAAA
ncbi:MAG: bifunctional metallophosphatase/5'-nucleotidase [Roseateles asaccharophilus]|uniref:5'-nucleotidase n=1 Tax=Roseateles asaccharophilus TaxID=582607 RepID=A0A4R6NE86_9BURK|nr:5'-nucleotidase C-terminal domain-containing protein [Roseateles asaccharophilus]MDN3542935.1 5'-nucleotidase C-terminal domain-containing protein [Roseateles asaccharophilus]TDP13365.1 5'-nucleotidase [Roseateles asaccharophilus]